MKLAVSQECLKPRFGHRHGSSLHDLPEQSRVQAVSIITMTNSIGIWDKTDKGTQSTNTLILGPSYIIKSWIAGIGMLACIHAHL